MHHLVVTGAVATASGPHPGSSEDVERLGVGIVDTVYVHVRAAAVFGIGVLLVGWFSAVCASSAPGSSASGSHYRPLSWRRRFSGRCSTETRCLGVSSSCTSSSAAAIWASLALAVHLWRPPELLETPVAAARELRIHERPTTLERPVLIGAFRGWNDGGQAATLAAGYLARLWGARKFAEIDPELFVDFQATRPMVSLEDGRTRKIEWPENTFYRARIPEANRDAILLVGVEPNYRWRTFSELITELASDLGVELAVTLGASSPTCRTRVPHP